jgi:hypothetical protein
VADGTFRSCPSEYQQLYTIQAIIRKKFFPLVFCFMKEKTNESYKEILNFLKTKIKNLRLQFLMVDFECAAISAFSEIFTIQLQRAFFILLKLSGAKLNLATKQKNTMKIVN